MKIFRMYATILEWHDGDSFKGFIDQGFFTFRGHRLLPIMFRIYGINAPELRDAGGPEARDYARSIVPPGEYACLSYHPDNFGRPIVDLLLGTNEQLFSMKMLSEGHAVPFRRD